MTKYAFEIVYLKDGAARTEFLTADQRSLAAKHWQYFTKHTDIPARMIGLGKDGKVHTVYSGPETDWNFETQRCIEVSYGSSMTYTFFCEKYPREDSLKIYDRNGDPVEVTIVRRCIKTVDEIREILFSGVSRIKRIEEVLVK